MRKKRSCPQPNITGFIPHDSIAGNTETNDETRPRKITEAPQPEALLEGTPKSDFVIASPSKRRIPCSIRFAHILRFNPLPLLPLLTCHWAQIGVILNLHRKFGIGSTPRLHLPQIRGSFQKSGFLQRFQQSRALITRTPANMTLNL